jgi:hypothetical protein
MSANQSPKKPDLIAYVVKENGEKSFYNRIGVAWKNSKGGVKIVLEAFPVSGELLLLPPREERS